MNFFEHQERARSNSRRMLVLFALAVLAVVAAINVVVLLVLGLAAEPDKDPQVSPAAAAVAVTVITLAVIACGSLYKTFSLRGGGGAVARALGGTLVSGDTRDFHLRRLRNVVEEMAIASGMPVPEIYVLEQESAINAFAAGHSTGDAAIAVTRGALEHLSRDELQGVVAHEYSHILRGDCRLNIRLIGVLYGIMMLTLFGRMIGSLFRGGSGGGRSVVVVRGGGGRRGGGKGGGGGAAIIAIIVVVVLITVIGYIGTFFARLIQAAISRQREFLADAAAVQFTRNPEGIAGALKKIGAHAEHGVLEHPRASEAAHMFFADGMARSFNSLFATHPPLDLRIRQIQPNWDGSFKSGKKGMPASSAAPVPAAAGRETGTVQRSGQSSESGRRMIEGMAVLGAIGTLSQSNLETARAINAAIPADLDARLREPQGARAVLLALVLVDNLDDDARQLELITEALREDQVADVRSLLPQVAALPRQARLGVLELAASTIAQSAETGRAAFFELIDALIAADEKISLYEFCLRRILRERLARGMRAPAQQGAVS